MKTICPFPGPATRSRQRRPFGVLLLATAMLCLSSIAVFADEHRGRERGHRNQDNPHAQGFRHREWRGEDRNYGYRPVYPQPYLYAQPVYVPPPVYYAPRQSPGITLFFPLDLR